MTYFARGLAAGYLGNIESARAAQEALASIHERLTTSNEGYWAEQVEIQRRAVSAWSLLAEGHKDDALREMKTVAELEDSTEKSVMTPGPLAPSRELLGEMLLQMNQPGPALEQFEATLKREPNRFRALYGAARAAQLKGDREASHRYFRALLKVCERADKPGRKEIAEAGIAQYLRPAMILSRHIVISRERGRDSGCLRIRQPESFTTFVDNSSPEADESYAHLGTQ